MTVIADLAALEGVIGRTPPAIALKVIDHLDETARHWISRSPLGFLGFGEGNAIGITLAGGEPGFAEADRTALTVPLALLDDPGLMEVGSRFCSLFLVPGIGETLRINGRIAAIEGDRMRVSVEECYAHCAKALIRSDFWSASPLDEAPGDPAAFVAASRFMALATADLAEGADLSPKGDPAGTMALLDGAALWFADRPGNRRVDSFRNILAQPAIASLLLVPGSCRIATVRGSATLTNDEERRAQFAVQGRIPALAVRIDTSAILLRESAALKRARLWPHTGTPEDVDPAKLFIAHVKLNKHKGLAAKIAAAALSVPGLMQKSLESDYKNKLY